MKKIRIGCGAGYGGDRLEPALCLMERGDLQYIVFECLAERTIALAQREKRENPDKGYNSMLEYRMERVLPLACKNKIKVITNMGAANPVSAMQAVAGIVKNSGLKGIKLAAIQGDDVLEIVRRNPDLVIMETGEPLSTILPRIISANAYLGCEAVVEALSQNADVIITGRVADPALFLGPLIYEFDWKMDDFDKLGKGTLTGHLLECAGQICGGYFADPVRKIVPELWNIGFPYAEVDESGDGFISKIENTGGLINVATCTEQLLYEIHDPSRYFTPDCIADFSQVEFEQTSQDRVRFRNATGRNATGLYKVSVGYQNGFSGEGQISYGGTHCLERAEYAAEIVRKRLSDLPYVDLRIDFIGLDSLCKTSGRGQKDPKSGPFSPSFEGRDIPEVRLRVCGRAETAELARHIGREVETLYTNGPAGGGGVTQKTEEEISIVSVLIPKNLIKTSILYSTL